MREHGGVLQRPPQASVSTSQADSACLDDDNSFLDKGWDAIVQ